MCTQPNNNENLGWFMANGKFVAYYRVSTQKQGQSGLGREAQQKAVSEYLNGGDWKLIGEFEEVETGKGSKALDKRPQLKAALAVAKKEKATLIIAKLDRLARNVHFTSGLLESGVDFVCADMPKANKVMLQMYSVMAEWEGEQISLRTKASLAAAKARGVKLGTAGAANLKQNIEDRQQDAKDFAEKLRVTLTSYKKSGMSLRQIVDALNNTGVRAAKGGEWRLTQVARVVNLLGI